MDTIDDFYFDQDIFAPKSRRMFSDFAFGAGIMFVLVGFMAIINLYASISFIIGFYLIFTREGVKIDTKNNKIKEYVKYFGIFERGKWEANRYFEQISILAKREKITAGVIHSRVVDRKSSINNAVVVLLDKSNHKKLEVFYTIDIEEAKKVAETLSEKTNFPIVVYNPIRISKDRR